MPGTINQETHFHLKGQGLGGSLTDKNYSTNAMNFFKRHVKNTVDWYDSQDALYCAYCRKALHASKPPLMPCRECISVLYCSKACVLKHRAEHRPVCRIHPQWMEHLQEEKEQQAARKELTKEQLLEQIASLKSRLRDQPSMPAQEAEGLRDFV